MSGRPVYIHNIALKDQGGTLFCKVKSPVIFRISSTVHHQRSDVIFYRMLWSVYESKINPTFFLFSPLPLLLRACHMRILKLLLKLASSFVKIKRGHVTQTFNLLSVEASSRKPSTNSFIKLNILNLVNSCAWSYITECTRPLTGLFPFCTHVNTQYSKEKCVQNGNLSR